MKRLSLLVLALISCFPPILHARSPLEEGGQRGAFAPLVVVFKVFDRLDSNQMVTTPEFDLSPFPWN